MPNIIPKLNLNKTPSLIENYSLPFASNIRVDLDETIHQDYSILPIDYDTNKYNSIISGNILNQIVSDFTENKSNNPRIYNYYIHRLNQIGNNFTIVGIIPYNTEFYIFAVSKYKSTPTSSYTYGLSTIIKFDEIDRKFYPCNCNWNYNGGEIKGNIITNLLSEKIINIAEKPKYNYEDIKIPLKHINLNKSDYTDDESVYTQSPSIPITNLNVIGTFSYVIPNGVYQFFIRYKIRDEFYTDWFPATKDCFAGNTNYENTSFGTVKYVNTHTDSVSSFIFEVEHIIPNNITKYESFQIGFILSHDDAIYARAWKHFNINTSIINFDYKAADAEEIDVTDLTKVTYNIYNVGNITNFKNKQYISNYTETDFNDDNNTLKSIADNINIEIAELQEYESGYGSFTVGPSNNIDDDIEYLLDDTNKLYYWITDNFKDNTYSARSLIKTLLEYSTGGFNSIRNNILKALRNELNSEGNKEDVPNIIENYSALNFNVHQQYINLDTAKNKAGLGKLNPTFPNDNIIAIYVTINDNKTSRIIINDENTETDIYNLIFYAIRREFSYLTNKGYFTDKEHNIINNITITFRRNFHYDKRVSTGLDVGTDDFVSFDKEPDLTRNSINQNQTDNIKIVDVVETYDQDINISFRSDIRLFKNISSKYTQFQTLIPYQKYHFYVHFVKDTGETTNGYICGNNNIEVPYKAAAKLLYPKFNNIVIPEGYSACFFSIWHYAINTSTIFDIRNKEFKKEYNDSTEFNSSDIEGHSIELNTRLIPGVNNLNCKYSINGVDKNLIADYHFSADTSEIRYFGCNGILTFNNTDININTNNLIYYLNNYESQQSIDATLTKCTPYININSCIEKSKVSNGETIVYKSYDNYKDLNLKGYLCDIYPINRERSCKYYTDGSSGYTKNYTNDDINQFTLTEFSKNIDTTDKQISGLMFTPINTVDSATIIYSNFNLNYLALSENPITKINRYKHSTDTTTDPEGHLWKLFTSTTLSLVYELPSMYKDYTTKTYSIINPNAINTFNNTIRSSKLVGDESKLSVFTFDPDDYYNVPTNKGIITNLVGVGDYILAHTQDSLFQFSGSNTLNSNNGEIQVSESQPFNSGIGEVFGTQYGFAGLKDSKDYIITQNGYIFFDRDSKVLYMYSGQGQLTKLSDPINKLINYATIINFTLANDYYNNRFFVSIKYKTKDNKSRTITLSYCFLDNIKSFISVHNFYFFNSFSTKTKCYFVKGKMIYEVNKDYNNVYSDLNNISNLEIDLIGDDAVDPYDNFYPISKSLWLAHKWFKYKSIVDVVINDNYEIVKTLNSITWSACKATEEYPVIDVNDLNTIKSLGFNNDTLPVTALRVYSNICSSELINFESEISNNAELGSTNAYKRPRFNEGKWTYNFFRDIENRLLNTNKNNYISDDNSLIEGQYFVVRFLFSNDFKLETIDLNYDNKL